MISHRNSESSFFFLKQRVKGFCDLKGNQSIVLFFQCSDETPILRDLEGTEQTKLTEYKLMKPKSEKTVFACYLYTWVFTR